MRKAKSRASESEMRPEYDFTGAVRGKYYERFMRNSNVVLLDPDVAAAFPSERGVERAPAADMRSVRLTLACGTQANGLAGGDV
jgi:hypothetical protein